MEKDYNRRKFVKTATIGTVGMQLFGGINWLYGRQPLSLIKVGIIGLDTGHSSAFTRLFNDPVPLKEFEGIRVVAAYPNGSHDIETSVKMIPGNTKAVQKLGVEIVGSIEELLSKVDVVLLETNDGRLHLKQALKVINAGKRMFIDKPVAASLADAMVIFESAKKNGVPIFSSSSLRFMDSAQKVVNGSIGTVTGADVYSPALIEKTHPDLFWYGIHGIETLFTIMGAGCKSVTRYYTAETDIVIGTWERNRLGTFRGLRIGKNGYGGTAFGDKGIATLGPFEGYKPLVIQIADFFRSGKPPVRMEDTLEIVAFMEAAEESKRKKGAIIELAQMMKRAEKINGNR